MESQSQTSCHGQQNLGSSMPMSPEGNADHDYSHDSHRNQLRRNMALLFNYSPTQQNQDGFGEAVAGTSSGHANARVSMEAAFQDCVEVCIWLAQQFADSVEPSNSEAVNDNEKFSMHQCSQRSDENPVEFAAQSFSDTLSVQRQPTKICHSLLVTKMEDDDNDAEIFTRKRKVCLQIIDTSNSSEHSERQSTNTVKSEGGGSPKHSGELVDQSFEYSFESEFSVSNVLQLLKLLKCLLGRCSLHVDGTVLQPLVKPLSSWLTSIGVVQSSVTIEDMMVLSLLFAAKMWQEADQGNLHENLLQLCAQSLVTIRSALHSKIQEQQSSQYGQQKHFLVIPWNNALFHELFPPTLPSQNGSVAFHSVDAARVIANTFSVPMCELLRNLIPDWKGVMSRDNDGNGDSAMPMSFSMGMDRPRVVLLLADQARVNCIEEFFQTLVGPNVDVASTDSWVEYDKYVFLVDKDEASLASQIIMHDYVQQWISIMTDPDHPACEASMQCLVQICARASPWCSSVFWSVHDFIDLQCSSFRMSKAIRTCLVLLMSILRVFPDSVSEYGGAPSIVVMNDFADRLNVFSEMISHTCGELEGNAAKIASQLCKFIAENFLASASGVVAQESSDSGRLSSFSFRHLVISTSGTQNYRDNCNLSSLWNTSHVNVRLWEKLVRFFVLARSGRADSIVHSRLDHFRQLRLFSQDAGSVVTSSTIDGPRTLSPELQSPIRIGDESLSKFHLLLFDELLRAHESLIDVEKEMCKFGGHGGIILEGLLGLEPFKAEIAGLALSCLESFGDSVVSNVVATVLHALTSNASNASACLLSNVWERDYSCQVTDVFVRTLEDMILNPRMVHFDIIEILKSMAYIHGFPPSQRLLHQIWKNGWQPVVLRQNRRNLLSALLPISLSPHICKFEESVVLLKEASISSLVSFLKQALLSLPDSKVEAISTDLAPLLSNLTIFVAESSDKQLQCEFWAISLHPLFSRHVRLHLPFRQTLSTNLQALFLNLKSSSAELDRRISSSLGFFETESFNGCMSDTFFHEIESASLDRNSETAPEGISPVVAQHIVDEFRAVKQVCKSLGMMIFLDPVFPFCHMAVTFFQHLLFSQGVPDCTMGWLRVGGDSSQTPFILQATSDSLSPFDSNSLESIDRTSFFQLMIPCMICRVDGLSSSDVWVDQSTGDLKISGLQFAFGTGQSNPFKLAKSSVLCNDLFASPIMGENVPSDVLSVLSTVDCNRITDSLILYLQSLDSHVKSSFTDISVTQYHDYFQKDSKFHDRYPGFASLTTSFPSDFVYKFSMALKAVTALTRAKAEVTGWDILQVAEPNTFETFAKARRTYESTIDQVNYVKRFQPLEARKKQGLFGKMMNKLGQVTSTRSRKDKDSKFSLWKDESASTSNISEGNVLVGSHHVDLDVALQQWAVIRGSESRAKLLREAKGFSETEMVDRLYSVLKNHTGQVICDEEMDEVTSCIAHLSLAKQKKAVKLLSSSSSSVASTMSIKLVDIDSICDGDVLRIVQGCSGLCYLRLEGLKGVTSAGVDDVFRSTFSKASLLKQVTLVNLRVNSIRASHSEKDKIRGSSLLILRVRGLPLTYFDVSLCKHLKHVSISRLDPTLPVVVPSHLTYSNPAFVSADFAKELRSCVSKTLLGHEKSVLGRISASPRLLQFGSLVCLSSGSEHCLTVLQAAMYSCDPWMFMAIAEHMTVFQVRLQVRIQCCRKDLSIAWSPVPLLEIYAKYISEGRHGAFGDWKASLRTLAKKQQEIPPPVVQGFSCIREWPSMPVVQAPPPARSINVQDPHHHFSSLGLSPQFYSSDPQNPVCAFIRYDQPYLIPFGGLLASSAYVKAFKQDFLSLSVLMDCRRSQLSHLINSFGGDDSNYTPWLYCKTMMADSHVKQASDLVQTFQNKIDKMDGILKASIRTTFSLIVDSETRRFIPE